MSIQISSPHFPITDAIRERVDLSVVKLNKIHPNKYALKVVIDRTSDHSLKCVAHYVGQFGTIDSSDNSEDLYHSIDLAFKKLCAQIKKHRAKFEASKTKPNLNTN
jgi:ribosomal subunit interface protein